MMIVVEVPQPLFGPHRSAAIFLVIYYAVGVRNLLQNRTRRCQPYTTGCAWVNYHWRSRPYCLQDLYWIVFSISESAERIGFVLS